VTEAVKKKPVTFEKFMRNTFKGVLDPPAAFLNRLGIMPNTVTIIGLIGTAIGAVVLALGHITTGGIIILLMGPIDALDGTMARLRGEASSFGAFVDSVTDRYSELAIYAGLLIYYIQWQNWVGIALVYLSAAGSVLVSYVKARAEGLGFTANVGILSRLGRILVLAPLLVINQPLIALGIIAVFANITALQRIAFVRKQARIEKPGSNGIPYR
jgi:CDP-diacylglycerol---glycerol-3-phosphate 3-phosphatidyltransferase